MSDTNMAALRSQAIRLNFLRPDDFDRKPIEVLEREYNGCGPDWLPNEYRRSLTSKFHRFEAAFVVHDDMFTNSDGTFEGFTRANKWLRLNCEKIVRDEVHWVRFWKRAELEAVCVEIADMCQLLGCLGWKHQSEAKR